MFYFIYSSFNLNKKDWKSKNVEIEILISILLGVLGMDWITHNSLLKARKRKLTPA